MALPKKYDFNDYDNYLTDPNPTTSAEAQDYFRNMDMLVTAMVDTFLWQPGTNYANGDVVKSPSMPNGAEAVCVAENGGKSSNVEPQWGNVGGENIADGTCFWKLRWEHWSKSVDEIADLTTGATNRLPNTTYNIGDVVCNKSNLKVALKCRTGGTTSSGELDISTKVVGESVSDGSVVWKVVSRDLSEEIKNNADNFENYLPLSGGTMNGAIRELTAKSMGDGLEGGRINFEKAGDDYPNSCYLDVYANFFRIIQIDGAGNLWANTEINNNGIYHNGNLVGLYGDIFMYRFGAEGVILPDGGTWMGLIMYVTSDGDYTAIGNQYIAGGSYLVPPSGFFVGVVILKRVK